MSDLTREGTDLNSRISFRPKLLTLVHGDDICDDGRDTEVSEGGVDTLPRTTYSLEDGQTSVSGLVGLLSVGSERELRGRLTGLSSRSNARILRLMPSDFFGTGGSSGITMARELGVEFAVLLWEG